jgi:hypothetical protein
MQTFQKIAIPFIAILIFVGLGIFGLGKRLARLCDGLAL